MATTVQQIYEAALARSTENAGGKLVVDGEMIAHLNRNFQARFSLMGVFQPDNAAASATLTFSGSPATAALPTDIADIIKLETSAGARAYLSPLKDKDRTWHLTPAVYRKGNNLITLGRSGDPIAAGTLTLFYLDAPATLSALASTLDTRYPVRFEMGLILDLALYMAIKDEKRDANRIAALRAEVQADNKMFLTLIGASDTAMSDPLQLPTQTAAA